MKHGFIKVAAAIPQLEVANCTYNIEKIKELVVLADGQGVEILCFPELAITGYTCQDLFGQQMLQEEAEQGLMRLVDFSRNVSTVIIVGVPVPINGRLMNCAAVVSSGKLLGFVPKSYLPNYKEFYERRWFTSAMELPECSSVHLCGQDVPLGTSYLFDNGHTTFGVEICEDLWAPAPPSNKLALAGAEIIFNLSSSNELVGKAAYLRSLVLGQSARCICGYVYAGSGFGESTQDVVFAGRAFVAENGTLLNEGKHFQLEAQMVVSEIDVERIRAERRLNTTFATSIAYELSEGEYKILPTPIPAVSTENFTLTRSIDPHPFVPQGKDLHERCEEILYIQSEGLAKRVLHTHADTVILGISGGLDSTLALLVCVHAFDRLGRDRKGIVGITMPGFGTTDRTYNNAIRLMKNLGITTREISIAEACRVHFDDLGHNSEVHDVTYENTQARERTQILMDAANQMNGIVVGTGDLSELALGWATYNGDHMSMYGVNTSVPKTLVRHLVTWAAHNLVDEFTRQVLLDVVETPISPELIPANTDGTIQQKTEDLVGPYELHDFFLYYFLRYGFRPRKIFWLAQQAFATQYGHDEIKKWLRTFCRRFFQQQFKRSCLPDGPKVGSCSLSPRGDWRMPSDASVQMWLDECDTL